MRKVFTKLAAILTTSSLALPLTACVYNFYVDSAKNTIIKSFADQTSSVIKSMILSKEIDTDTPETIQDMLAAYPNSSIRNQSGSKSLSTWEEFTDLWGFDKKIKIEGFKPTEENYFRGTGTGSRTQSVNTYKTVNDVLNQLGLVSGLNIADNRLVYNLIKDGDVKDTIVNFLNQTKKTEGLDTITTLLKNLVIGSDWEHPDDTSFTKTVVNPLTSLLNNLVEGWWKQDLPTPANGTELKAYMDNWKDENGDPFSQWNEGSDWTLDESYYTKWDPSEYNFYRAGVLVNHLFYKIGRDYESTKTPIANPDPEATPTYRRFLGEIIQEHVSLSPIGLDDYFLPDLMQFVPKLLENPSYIISIIEAVVPIIKEWILKMSDINQGVKALTFGKKYSTNDSENSYNVSDIINNIGELLLEPNKIADVIRNLFTINKGAGNAFTYDIQVINGSPLPNIIFLIKGEIEKIITQLMEVIDTNDVKNAFKNILNIYNQWIKQYDDKNEGIIFNLKDLKDFLLNDTNGLITLINKDMMPILYQIMTNPDPITDTDSSEYWNFYKSIGGKLPLPDGTIPLEFETNSVIQVLKDKINDTTEPFGQLILILLGNSSDKNAGLFSFIIESNNQWLKDNYTGFFDVTNKGSGRVYNQIMTTSTINDEISNTLSYNFTYKINNKTYYFSVRCKSRNPVDDTGTKDFYFTNIKLNKIT